MAETHALSLAELDAYDPQPLRRGDSAHYLCPLCHDERPGRPRDNAHRKLRVWPHGAWYCVRCDAKGLLAEYKTGGAREDVFAWTRRRAAPSPEAVAETERRRVKPAAAADAEDARRRDRAAELWHAAVPIDAPDAAPGAAYLEGRGVPLAVAARAGVRYHPAWPGRVGDTLHRLPAVVFRVADEAGAGVAAEGRWIAPPTPKDKARTYGPRGRGLFCATPGALDVSGVTVCEGAITALSMAAAGYPAVSVCGQVVPAWLARRLALRDVFIAFDEGETKTEEKAAAFVRELVAAGARPYRLRLPAGVDVNDRLQAVGADVLRDEVADAICVALGVTPRTS